MEENTLTSDLIDRHHHQSQNVEETDSNTSTNQQHNIVEIETSSDSDPEGSSFVGSAL